MVQVCVSKLTKVELDVKDLTSFTSSPCANPLIMAITSTLIAFVTRFHNFLIYGQGLYPQTSSHTEVHTLNNAPMNIYYLHFWCLEPETSDIFPSFIFSFHLVFNMLGCPRLYKRFTWSVSSQPIRVLSFSLFANSDPSSRPSHFNTKSYFFLCCH